MVSTIRLFKPDWSEMVTLASTFTPSIVTTLVYRYSAPVARSVPEISEKVENEMAA